MKTTIFKLTVLGSAVLAAVSVQANSLRGELAHALQHNPQMQASRHASASAESRARAAEANRLPTFNLGYDYGAERINSLPMATAKTINGTPGTQIMSGPGSNWMWSQEQRRGLSINSQLPVYNGGKTSAIVDTARIDALSANLNFQAQEQDTLLEAITAYLGVAKAKTLIELAKQNEETTTKQLDLETKRVAAGGGVKVDAMQAQTRLQIVRERVVYYNQMLREALARYEQTFGRAPDLNQIQDLDIPDQAIPGTSSAALLLAKENNPRLKVALLQIERAQHQLTIAQSATKPAVDIVGTINRTHNTNQTSQREDGALFVRSTWSLNLGGEHFKREQAAVSDNLEAMSKADTAESKMNESVRVAWNQVVNGKERLQLLTNAANISRAVMLDRKTLRDAGKETALATLDAEVEYYGVLSNKVNNLYDMRIGAYRLLAAMGKLSSADIGVEGDFKLSVKPLRLDLDALAKVGN
jgi:outer membrane protein TolC